jgi:hypothetical protein
MAEIRFKDLTPRIQSVSKAKLVTTLSDSDSVEE